MLAGPRVETANFGWIPYLSSSESSSPERRRGVAARTEMTHLFTNKYTESQKGEEKRACQQECSKKRKEETDQTKMCWHAQKNRKAPDSDRANLVVSAWSCRPGKGVETHPLEIDCNMKTHLALEAEARRGEERTVVREARPTSALPEKLAFVEQKSEKKRHVKRITCLPMAQPLTILPPNPSFSKARVPVR